MAPATQVYAAAAARDPVLTEMGTTVADAVVTADIVKAAVEAGGPDDITIALVRAGA